jgi:hypothetical protein
MQPTSGLWKYEGAHLFAAQCARALPVLRSEDTDISPHSYRAHVKE